MASTNRWYDGAPVDSQSDNGQQGYWYDGAPLADVTSLDQTITGSTGIATAEAFGSGGSCLPEQAIAGSTGVATAEAVGSGGIVAGPITGSTGIGTGLTFGVGGAIGNDQDLAGSAGIVSSETFSPGVLIVGIAGSTGIVTAEAFSVGVVAGPITGSAGIESGEIVDPTGAIVAALVFGTTGITSAEAFSIGIVAGPIVGTAGIASAEAFGSGGFVAALVYGTAGIASAETVSSGGTLSWGIAGYDGISSAEAFGRGMVTHGEELALYIRGRKRAMRANTLNVQGDLNGRYVASFELIEYTGARPNPGDEVIYLHNGVRRFAGFVQTYKESFFHSRDVMMLKVTCVDYKRVCEERTFGRVYSTAPFSSRAILLDIFTAILQPEGFTWNYDDCEDIVLTEGDRIAFEDETVATCLDRLAGIFGFDWFIDFDRVFHAERNRFSLAPYNFRDNDGLWRDMEVTRSDEQYRNRQGARTAVPTSGQRVSTLVGNGTHSYYLGWPIPDLPKITVNTTQKTVINYADRASAGPWVFAYEANSNLLRHNPTLTAYTSSDTIIVTAPSATIDVYFAEDNAEIARQQARAGGTGIREAVTKATNIRDRAVAASFTQSMIDRLGRYTEEVSVETDTEGWYVGQMCSVITSRPRVTNWFVVQSVTMREVDLSFLRYQLKLSGKEMPLIHGITVTPAVTPGEYELGITIDRGVDGFSVGQPFEISGVEGSGYTYGTIGLPPGPYGPGINGTWVVETIEPTENIITCTTEGSGYGGVDLGLGTFTYTGGSGGSEGGGGEIPFGGNIVPTNPGLPGNNTESIPPQGGPLIVVGVNTFTAEVTTDHAHGLTTGTSVMIAGVSGCDGSGSGFNAGTINNSNTRITVTSPTTFIAEDVYLPGLSGAPGFVNDRHGRVIPRSNVIRFTQGVSTANILSTLAGAAVGAGSNLNTDTATFVLSNSIPGISSRPLQVVSGATNPWVQQADIQVVTDVSAILGTPGTGADVVIDVLRNGVSLFASSGITIPDGSTELVRSTDLAEVPTVIRRSDVLTVNVTQVGSDFAGCDATVQVNLRG